MAAIDVALIMPLYFCVLERKERKWTYGAGRRETQDKNGVKSVFMKEK